MSQTICVHFTGDDGDIFSVPEELKEDVKLLPDDDGFILNMNEGLEKDTVFLNVLVDGKGKEQIHN